MKYRLMKNVNLFEATKNQSVHSFKIDTVKPVAVYNTKDKIEVYCLPSSNKTVADIEKRS